MYKLKKFGNLHTIKIRGIYLTKKIFKKTKKQTLIFLRAPKHFNAGLFKVYSLNNNSYFNIKTKFLININYLSFYRNYLFSILPIFYKFQPLFLINSLKIKIKTKIKW